MWERSGAEGHARERTPGGGGDYALEAAVKAKRALQRNIMPGWKKNIPACLQADQEGGRKERAGSTSACSHRHTPGSHRVRARGGEREREGECCGVKVVCSVLL